MIGIQNTAKTSQSDLRGLILRSGLEIYQGFFDIDKCLNQKFDTSNLNTRMISSE